jgi:hypothetical protein
MLLNMAFKNLYPEIKFYLLYSIVLTLLTISFCNAQPKFTGKEDLFSTPKKYTVFFNAESPKIDGKLDDQSGKMWNGQKISRILKLNANPFQSGIPGQR